MIMLRIYLLLISRVLFSSDDNGNSKKLIIA